MADRYWVGGTGTWTLAGTANWSDTSGGASGFSAPTNNDNAFFDGNSGGGTITVSGTRSCLNLTCTGFTGTLTGSGTPIIDFYDSCTLATTMTVNSSVGPIFRKFGTAAGTFTSTGKTIRSFELGSAATLALSDAMVSAGSITITQGTFTTNNYAVTATSLSSSNSNSRTINLGSSTVTLNFATAVNFATSTNLTFNAGTSTINFSASTFAGGGQTFYNVANTSATNAIAFTGANTFNNLTIIGRTSAGINIHSFNSNQIINGTLTLSAGTDATCRTFLQSNTFGTTRTLTCAAFSGTDTDFRDITIAGAAAPVSGTRLGDCKGNSGITFGSGTNKYWVVAAGGNWNTSIGWATTSGGSANVNNFPLPQDTAIIQNTGLNTSAQVTINVAYNIGTVDMSGRTNAMTLSCAVSPFVHGNWINGTGTTIAGIGTVTYAGRGSQTIRSEGKTFTFASIIDSPGGSVTLQDAFVTNRSTTGALLVNSGTFNADIYNVSLTGAASSFSSSNSNVRTVAIGSGTWTIAGSAGWTTNTSTNLTLTGTGTISMTSASAKTFTGGNVQTFPTINQGGTGTLTISGSNKFADITDTAIGRVQFTGGTTNEFTAFSLGGVSGNLLALGSTNTTQVTLKKPSAWNVGANSTDGGNNTGLSFTAGGNDYLNISYVIGVVTSAPTSTVYYGSTNVTTLYYGSTPVTAVYYGSTQVF